MSRDRKKPDDKVAPQRDSALLHPEKKGPESLVSELDMSNGNHRQKDGQSAAPPENRFHVARMIPGEDGFQSEGSSHS